MSDQPLVSAQSDREWFKSYPKRLARIRRPLLGESVEEFQSLGPHNYDRRRMIVVRIPDGPHRGVLMPIPFLLFADETVENEDRILMPIVDKIMREAAGGAQ